MNLGTVIGLTFAGRLEERCLPRQYGRVLRIVTVPARPYIPSPRYIPSPENQKTTHVLAHIEAHPGAMQSDIRTALGYPANLISGILSDLGGRESIRREGEKGHFRYYATGRRQRNGRGPGKWA